MVNISFGYQTGLTFFIFFHKHLDLNTLIKYESGNSSKLNTNVRVHSARQHQENDGLGRTEMLVNPNLPKGSSSKKQEAHRFRSAQLDERKDKDTQTNMERPRSTAKKPKITNQQQAKYKIPTRQVLVKNTPVDLYQKYKSDWEKFKKYIPGENSREEVRKVVRRRVQKPPPPKPTVRR